MPQNKINIAVLLGDPSVLDLNWSQNFYLRNYHQANIVIIGEKIF